MKKSELKTNYSIFGGKGDVWSNTAHISKDSSPVTLCGKPMLSSNWCRIENIEEIGCQKCIELYNKENIAMKSQIHLFNMFALNYPHNFIETIWGPENYLTKHLQEKFAGAYEVATSYGAMIKFWAELDEQNRAILENWIINNYKG